MVNLELIKLLGILGGGLIILVVGGIITHKKKNRADINALGLRDMNTSTGSAPISSREAAGKKYIEDYKGQYPRDSIKNGLIKAGNSDIEAENWLNKYFN